MLSRPVGEALLFLTLVACALAIALAGHGDWASLLVVAVSSVLVAVGAVRLFRRSVGHPAEAATVARDVAIAVGMALLAFLVLWLTGAPPAAANIVAFVVGGGFTFPLARRYRPGASLPLYLLLWLAAAFVAVGMESTFSGALR